MSKASMLSHSVPLAAAARKAERGVQPNLECRQRVARGGGHFSANHAHLLLTWPGK